MSPLVAVEHGRLSILVHLVGNEEAHGTKAARDHEWEGREGKGKVLSLIKAGMENKEVHMITRDHFLLSLPDVSRSALSVFGMTVRGARFMVASPRPLSADLVKRKHI